MDGVNANVALGTLDVVTRSVEDRFIPTDLKAPMVILSKWQYHDFGLNNHSIMTCPTYMTSGSNDYCI